MVLRALLGFGASLVLVACSTESTSSPVSTAEAGGSQGDASGSADSSAGQDAAGGTSTSGGESDGESPNTSGSDGAADSGGGQGDAGGTASDEGGGASCPAIVCDDFESGGIDPNKWMVLLGGGGTAMVQTQKVENGKYALQVHGVAGGSANLGPNSDDWAHLLAQNATALNGATTFGRANMYFPTEAAASLHMTVLFAGTNGTGPANGPAPYPKLRRLEVGTYFGTWQPGMDLHDVSPLVEVVTRLSGDWPTDEWFCIEWEFQDQPDQITVWVNGMQVASFDSMNCQGCNGSIYDGMSSGIIGGFAVPWFALGFHDWHPAQAFDIYYDDVALDTKRIGCLAAPQ